MSGPELLIIIPAHNEAATIAEIIARVQAADLNLPCELVIVDAASTAATHEILEKLATARPDGLRVFFHEKNRGKGVVVSMRTCAAS